MNSLLFTNWCRDQDSRNKVGFIKVKKKNKKSANPNINQKRKLHRRVLERTRTNKMRFHNLYEARRRRIRQQWRDLVRRAVEHRRRQRSDRRPFRI